MEGDEEAAVNDIDQWFSPRGVLGGVWGKVRLLQSGGGVSTGSSRAGATATARAPVTRRSAHSDEWCGLRCQWVPGLRRRRRAAVSLGLQERAGFKTRYPKRGGPMAGPTEDMPLSPTLPLCWRRNGGTCPPCQDQAEAKLECTRGLLQP